MSKLPIYLDYMATTPIDPLVLEEMLPFMQTQAGFGNAASVTHAYGIAALKAVETARATFAQTIGATPESIIFTSGATEATNLALIGASRFYQRKGRHIITLATEHKSVLATCEYLTREGFSITYLMPKPNGLLDLETLKAALTPETILVSIMHVNNEIGVIQDINAIGALLASKGILFHVDAAQSAGKLAINLTNLNVHLMSFSAHKNYGPKGVGALYVRQRPRVRLEALSFGGMQERGLRAGTQPVHQIVGMSAAFVLSEQLREQEQARLLALRQYLWHNIRVLPNIQLNGDEKIRVANNLNVSFTHVDASKLLPALSELAISNASACSAASQHPSYVLKALGLKDEQAFSALRISLGRFTTEEDIDNTISIMLKRLPSLMSN